MLVPYRSGAKRKYAMSSTKAKTSAKKAQLARIPRPVRSFNQLGFPKTLKFVHKYCESVAVSGTAGVPFKYQFSCNGLYDPNITGTGHQPMYFDQVAGLYNQYRVIGSKLRASWSTGSGTTVPYIFGCYIDDDSAAFISQNDILEQKSTKWTSIAPQTPNMGNIQMFWSARSNFGPAYVDQNFQGTGSANPSEQQYFTLFGYAQDSTSAVAGWVTVELEYITIWNELRSTVGS